MIGLLEGKVALVTGAGSGIGRASALAFAHAGAKVIASDVNEETAASVAAEIVSSGGSASAIRCDVSKPAEIVALIEQIGSIHDRLDCAFNNAGIPGTHNELVDYPEAEWGEVINTNLTSVFICMKHEITQMLRQGGGTIVNCASVSGLAATRMMPAYCASKHGIIGLTKVAALDYASRNIRINAICPGTIHTRGVDMFLEREPDLAPKYMADIVAAVPIGRLGTPDEIADAVVWLSGPTATFMVGHALVADGGKIIW